MGVIDSGAYAPIDSGGGDGIGGWTNPDIKPDQPNFTKTQTGAHRPQRRLLRPNPLGRADERGLQGQGPLPAHHLLLVAGRCEETRREACLFDFGLSMCRVGERQRKRGLFGGLSVLWSVDGNPTPWVGRTRPPVHFFSPGR